MFSGTVPSTNEEEAAGINNGTGESGGQQRPRWSNKSGAMYLRSSLAGQESQFYL
jgi:hypothetical protein